MLLVPSEQRFDMLCPGATTLKAADRSMAVGGHAFNSPSGAFGRCRAVCVGLTFVDSVMKMGRITGVNVLRVHDARDSDRNWSQENALGSTS
ncbi:MAG: hypothetical protein ACR2OZ_10030 [Verrucomicrobiales bacterium]